MAEELIEIEGIVEHIVFTNEQNGYTVCELSNEKDEYFTVVGIMPFLSVGETIKALGKWEVHASFGRQFKAQAYEKQLPVTEGAILKYLASGAVKGIGPKTAAKIIEKFGEDAFDVIENNPEWLTGIPGISPKKADQISENFKSTFGIRAVMMFCRDHFGPTTAVKIYKRWGGAAVDIIKQNPYVLCDEISGVGFESADKMARSLGMDTAAPERIKAGLKYLLAFNAYQNGHAFIPEEKLTEAAAKALSVDCELVESCLDELCEKGDTVRSVVGNRKCVYLEMYYTAEKYTAEKLKFLDATTEKLSYSDIDRFIENLEYEYGIKYAALQKRAVTDALRNGVTVLTGGPGTGKTTVIRAMTAIFSRLDMKFALAAPTGRAAKRMSEVTSCEAKTIHRLLETEYSDDARAHFRKNEKDLLSEDVIIIDEASMLDILICEALLRAMKPGSRLILIGDADQLPSVGVGLVLNDIISSGAFPATELKEIFRQAGESMIVTNAHAINSGEYPSLTSKDNDFFFLPRSTDEQTAKTIADLCSERLPRKYGEKVNENIQVITPSHGSAAGTECLNALLQSRLNPPSKKKKEKKVRNIILREGDRVMQIKNNYSLEWESDDRNGTGVFNGDTGFIESIDDIEETVTVRFDDRTVVYDYTMLDELEHAYAITIHKSQGSEYPIVIIPIYSYSPRLLTRNLLYTAVTRAKEMLIMVGNPDIVRGMVDNNRKSKRYTGLSRLLEECGS